MNRPISVPTCADTGERRRATIETIQITLGCIGGMPALYFAAIGMMKAAFALGWTA